MSPVLGWPALAAARDADPSTRTTFCIGGRPAGSVARAHLDVLRAWPALLRVSDSGVDLQVPLAQRDSALRQMNTSLREQGLIRAWRDEIFSVPDLLTDQTLAAMERAAARFWGTLTLGAHANGYLADAAGRPTHLWVAQRAEHKATDAGLFDNLIGGGVAQGQSPFDALVREGGEEAGLAPTLVRTARAGSVIRLHRSVAEGFQLEELHCFDLCLPPSCVPRNTDGEVQNFRCWPVKEALALAAGTSMTVDAALVSLDFAVRHGLLAAPAGWAALLR